MSRAVYRIGDTRDVMAAMPDGSVDLVLTSPPFLALRSYLPADHPDKGREIGSEPTPAEFLQTLLELTAEWGRLLAPHGSICVELGDTYAGSGGAGGDYTAGGLKDGQNQFVGSSALNRTMSKNARVRSDEHARGIRDMHGKVQGGGAGWPLDKSLCGIPHLYHLSLAYGRNLLTGEESPAGRWRVRNVVAWCRPNPAVGALGDKFRPATSYMTIATRSRTRWFDLDAVRTPLTAPDKVQRNGGARTHESRDPSGKETNELVVQNPAGAPPLDWWEVSTEAYSGSHYACVDAATEALTPTGWKSHDQLRDGDMIAVVDQDGASWRFEPAQIHRFPFSGELVAIDKRVTNQRLTQNHRVLYRTRKDPNPRIREAATLTTGCQIPVAAEMDPGGVGPGEKAAALAGWFCAEGGIGRSGEVYIWQSESANAEHCDTIRPLLDALGVPNLAHIRERVGVTGKPHVTTRWTLRGPVAEWLRQFHKNLPMSAVFGWSDADARALLGALIDGDGHRRPDGRMQFVQKDRTTAERVQMLAVRLGYRSTLSPRDGGGWSVYISPGRWVDLRSGVNGNESAIGREHYEGTVWCPEVSSGVWLARRNGQPFVTGNTWPRKLLDRPILAMCPRQVCTVCGEPRRRIVKASDGYSQHLGESWADREDGRDKAAGRERNSHSGQPTGARISTASYDTLGWTECDCPGGDDRWRRGHVLDPFGGSGTTAAVATHHGRDCTLIDIDERNVELARERVGMFLDVIEPEEAA